MLQPYKTSPTSPSNMQAAAPQVFLKIKKEEHLQKHTSQRIELKKMNICKYVCFRENIDFAK